MPNHSNRSQKTSKKETVELERISDPKDAYAKPQPKNYEKETVELERVSDPKDAYAKPQPKD